MTTVRLVPGFGEHDARSEYAELFWTPVLGPTGYLLWRRLSTVLEPNVEREFDLVTCCGDLGVSSHGTARRTVARLVLFGVMREDGPEQYVVCARMPRVGDRRLSRMTERMQAIHRVVCEGATA